MGREHEFGIGADGWYCDYPDVWGLDEFYDPRKCLKAACICVGRVSACRDHMSSDWYQEHLYLLVPP